MSPRARAVRAERAGRGRAAVSAVCALAGSLLCSAAAAQPARPVADGVEITVPQRIEIHADGRVELHVSTIKARSVEAARPHLPTRVPVYTRLSPGEKLSVCERITAEEHADGTVTLHAEYMDFRVPDAARPGEVLRAAEPRIIGSEGGALLAGVYSRPIAPDGARRSTPLPLRISLDADGEYRVEAARFPSKTLMGHVWPESDEIDVEYFQIPEFLEFRPPAERGPWTVTYTYTGPALPPAVATAINTILARVKARTELTLSGSIGFEDIFYTFAALPPGAGAGTFPATQPPFSIASFPIAFGNCFSSCFIAVTKTTRISASPRGQPRFGAASPGRRSSRSSNPSGASTSATRNPGRMPSFFASGVPEYPAATRSSQLRTKS